MKINSFHLEDKTAEEMSTWSTMLSTFARPREVPPLFETKMVHSKFYKNETGSSIMGVRGEGRDVAEQFQDIMMKVKGNLNILHRDFCTKYNKYKYHNSAIIYI